MFLQSIFLAALLRPTSYYKKKRKASSCGCQDNAAELGEGEADENFLTQTSSFTDNDSDLKKYNNIYEQSADVAYEDEALCSTSNSEPSLLENNNKKTEADFLAAELINRDNFAQIYGSGYSSLAAPFASTHTLHDLDSGNKQVTTEASNITTDASLALNKANTITSYNWKLWIDKQVSEELTLKQYIYISTSLCRFIGNKKPILKNW